MEIFLGLLSFCSVDLWRTFWIAVDFSWTSRRHLVEPWWSSLSSKIQGSCVLGIPKLGVGSWCNICCFLLGLRFTNFLRSARKCQNGTLSLVWWLLAACISFNVFDLLHCTLVNHALCSQHNSFSCVCSCVFQISVSFFCYLAFRHAFAPWNLEALIFETMNGRPVWTASTLPLSDRHSFEHSHQ